MLYQNHNHMKLIKTVKREETGVKFISSRKEPSSMFMITRYGYRVDGSLSSNIIQERRFEIFDQLLTEYPKELLKNEKAQLIVTSEHLKQKAKY